jgi:hypothetical protein
MLFSLVLLPLDVFLVHLEAIVNSSLYVLLLNHRAIEE